jgi:hypothetical protein
MLEQHALSLAAFADDGGDMALMDLQIDSIQNRPSAKTLGDISKFDDRWIQQSTSRVLKRLIRLLQEYAWPPIFTKA